MIFLQGHVTVSKLALFHNTTCNHVLKQQAMRGRLCAGSFCDFFPFSRRGLRYFVFSALDISGYKRFDGNIYQDLRKLSLLFCHVNEHDFEPLWLWDVNPLEQQCFDRICLL